MFKAIVNILKYRLPICFEMVVDLETRRLAATVERGQFDFVIQLRVIGCSLAQLMKWYVVET